MKRALLLSTLVACDPTPAPRPPVTPPAATSPVSEMPAPEMPEMPARFEPAAEEAVTKLSRANNAFGLALYRKLPREGNLAMSPASIAVALGMTQAGARGATAEEMQTALGLGDVPKPHDAYGTLLRSWQAEAKMPYTLRVANRLFASQALDLHAAFVELTSDHYQAPVEELAFESAPEEARARINDWVSEQTAQKIETLLPPGSIDTATRLVLTNAVYFQGSWAAPFEDKATQDAAFYAPGGEVKVPTMRQKAFFQYAEVDGAKLLEMPYRGGRWVMTLVLPDARDGWRALEERLTEAALSGFFESLQRFEVRVALPRFTIESEQPLALSEALAALGMRRVFDPAEADLKGIAEPPPGQNLFLSQVFHKAFVKVDEKGTEAAAATGAVVSVTSMPLETPEPKTFIADHPFLFFIRDRKTESLLFAGRLVTPR